MENLKQRAAVIDLGSGAAAWNEVDEDGAYIGTAYTFPTFNNMKLTDNTDSSEIETDGSETVNVDGKRSVMLEMTVLQKDMASMLFMTETMRGKRIQILKEVSESLLPNEDGSVDIQLYWLGAVCKILPSVEAPIGRGHEMTWKFQLEAMTGEGESGGAYEVNLATQFSGSLGFRQTIAGNMSFSSSGKEYYDYIEITP